MRRRNAIPRNERQALAKERALAALALSRREGLSPRAAAKAVGTSLSTMRRYVGSALRQQGPGGHYRVTAHDRIARPLNFLTVQDMVVITVRSSRTASLIAEYTNARKAYWNKDHASALEKFRGKSFRAGGITYPFITDPQTLDQLGEAGFKFEGLYRAIYGRA
jgi:hypothetical protein